jgi:predicted alpha/beta superfamily hydrolase
MSDTHFHCPAVETHLVRSRQVEQEFKIQVMLPPLRRGCAPNLPTVYATDANLTFDVLKGLSYSLQSPERNTPPFMLVGIGYPSDNPFAGAMLRARDFTFPGYPQLSTTPPAIDGVLLPGPGGKDFYGAEAFQRFLKSELIPFIEERYATVPEERTYFGHSAGGGFGLFTLFTARDLFRNYIISSPGLLFNGTSSAGVSYQDYDFVLRDARRFLASGQTLQNDIFMSVGSEEEYEPALLQWQLTSSFFRLTALLEAAGVPGLRLTTEVFRGETHMSVWPLAFMHGIAAVIGHRHV